MERLDNVIIPGLRQLFEGTRPDQYDAATPCEAWKVRDLMGHLVTGGRFFAGAFADAPTAPPDDVGDDLPAAFSAAAAAFSTAVKAPGALDKTVTLPYGDLPAPVVLELAACDLLIHSWDLATATGQPFTPPAEIVDASDTFLRGFLPPSAREGGTAFGAEVPTPAGATPIQRLVAFSGRTP